jgi:hypothetical protein
VSRGIVIGQRISPDGLTMNGSVENADIVRWLLYWDNITYAGIGLNGGSISGNHPAEIDYLESLGVFNTEIVDLKTLGQISVPHAKPGTGEFFGVAGNQFPTFSAAARVKLCQTLSQRTGDIWSLGQSGGETLMLPSTNNYKELLDIQLNNCLPVPSAETSFEDILNFKENYDAELERLRFALDALREKVLSSSDERRALDMAMKEISIALEDVKNSMNGKGINVLSESVSLYTENPSIGFWSVLGGILGASQGIPIEVAAGAGLAVPTAFKFLKRNVLGGNNLPNSESDFSYAFEVSRLK